MWGTSLLTACPQHQRQVTASGIGSIRLVIHDVDGERIGVGLAESLVFSSSRPLRERLPCSTRRAAR